MLERSLAVAVAALVAFAAPVSAQEKARKDTTTRLPVNAFADAKEGDWSTYVVTMKVKDMDDRTTQMTWRVASVGEDGAVKVTNETTGREPHDHRGSPFSTKEAPTIAKFCLDDHFTVEGEPKAEKVSHEGQEFDCTRLTVIADGGKTKWTLWLAPGVKACGIVTSTVAVEGRSIEIKLGGYGAKGATTWGKTPEDVKKSLEKAGADKAAADKAAAEKDGLDLSTKLKAAETIIKVLKAGEKDKFKKCLTKKILEEQKDKLDEFFALWKKEVVDRGISAEQFVEHVKLSLEDGGWKLDEH